MTELELTSEQKHEISVELKASDFYETVPFLNHVLKVLGYSDYMEDDSEREELRWTKRKEPLIKDKKIRKAVRAWAEAVGGSTVCFYDDTDYEDEGRLKIYKEGYPAVFSLGHRFYDLEFDTQYTIAELCGEEEE